MSNYDVNLGRNSPPTTAAQFMAQNPTLSSTQAQTAATASGSKG